MTSSTYENFLTAFLAFGVIVWLVRYFVWRSQELPDLDSGELVGHLRDWEVRLVGDADRGRGVGIAIERFHPDGPNIRYYAVLAPDQARELAGWLRVAAAPGRTLAIARVHVKESGNPHGAGIVGDASRLQK